jgi:hypothetical protein
MLQQAAQARQVAQELLAVVPVGLPPEAQAVVAQELAQQVEQQQVAQELAVQAVQAALVEVPIRVHNHHHQ